MTDDGVDGSPAVMKHQQHPTVTQRQAQLQAQLSSISQARLKPMHSAADTSCAYCWYMLHSIGHILQNASALIQPAAGLFCCLASNAHHACPCSKPCLIRLLTCWLAGKHPDTVTWADPASRARQAGPKRGEHVARFQVVVGRAVRAAAAAVEAVAVVADAGLP
jgi:hypothetical protein